MVRCHRISLFLRIWTLSSFLSSKGVQSYSIVAARSGVLHTRKSCLRAVSSDDDLEELPASFTRSSSYLATCIPGLAPCLARELEDIHPDIADIELSGSAAVTFTATRAASLSVLCWTRTAHRLLELVAASSPDPRDQLYDRNDIHRFISREIDIRDLLGDGKGGLLTISVKAILNNPRQLPKELSHSHYTALSIKNALCDVVRDMRGDRPDVDTDNPDVPLVAMLRGRDGGASISLYRSLHPPGSLHRRGYRQGIMHKAAMKESLAAGLLIEAGWMERVDAARKGENSKTCLVDPMAGSGSLVLEATMMAADISPGLMRIRCQVPGQNSPPVTRWKSDENATKLWKDVLRDATRRAKDGLTWMRSDAAQLMFRANDLHPGAVDILEDSADAAGLSNFIDVSNMDCYDLRIDEIDKDASYFVVTNPPWGVRLTEDIASGWDGLRHFLRDVCPDSTEAWVLSGHKAATASLKLKRDRMVPIQTGDQNLRWIRYTIGQKKDPQTRSKPTSASSSRTSDQEDSW